jgi:hypothetical protein
MLLLALLVFGQLFSVYEFGYGLHHLTSHEALLHFAVVWM